MRLTNPRYPQLYGQPKIHKPGAPIRPIVAFYNSPLSALHKTLSNILKPLTSSSIRLKDSNAFIQHLTTTNTPSYSYYFSLDVVSLYTNCDMRAAVDTAIARLEENPDLLPSPLTPQTMRDLLLFCLDNAYFEFDGNFYKQTSGGVMGSPLTVTLAEIRTSQLEQHALDTFADPLHSYRHFVDDGIGAARDADHATAFLHHINSLSPDLQYTIEHPKDGFLPYLDVLLHPDLSTSIYRKPTHTNLYLKYNSSTPASTRRSVIQSLTRRAYNLCSPQHLQQELDTVYSIFLANGFPPHETSTLMDSVRDKLHRKPTIGDFDREWRDSQRITHRISLPYHPDLANPLKRILNRYNIAVSFSSSSTSLRSTLTRTKSSIPSPSTSNVIYRIPCLDCPASYIGQTKRTVLTRITDHERHYRLDKPTDSYGNIKSAPALHALKSSHTMGWNNMEILTTAPSSHHLDLLEHSAITILKPELNRTLKGPAINPQWNSLLPRITSSFRPRPSNISKFGSPTAS